MQAHWFSKGIILAGGAGTRLHPATKAVSKQMLPIFDKPMIYYPLTMLIQAGICDILVISTPRDIGSFEDLLGDGSEIGLRISYAVQARPEGIAQALLIGRDFVADENVALILGDNLFIGDRFQHVVRDAASHREGATIFAKPVTDAYRYGVVALDADAYPTSIVEKPRATTSNLAVTGLYLYDNEVVKIAEQLRPSARGELEITDVNRAYLDRKRLRVACLDEQTAWFDAGTHESYLAASLYVEAIQRESGTRFGCIEEAAYRRCLLTPDQMLALSYQNGTSYGEYLRELVQEMMSAPICSVEEVA